MDTLLTKYPTEAARFVKRGGVVAFPTETVYGLGANVFDEKAIEKIFEAKQRPADNPLIAHVGGLDQIQNLVTAVTPIARRLIEAFFPGPITLVMKKSDRVPLIATAGLDTIGVRMPGHQLAREFLKACGIPVAAPSANISGRPSPTTWEAVYEDLNGRIDCILQGEATEIGLESTVVDCTGKVPLVLRTGAVSLEQIAAVVTGAKLNVANIVGKPRSPGLKHRHYSPRAKVIIVTADADVTASASSGFIGLTSRGGNFKMIRICESVEDYARSLFEFFRECDRQGVATIYCEPVSNEGIGAAVMDRLIRAAEG